MNREGGRRVKATTRLNVQWRVSKQPFVFLTNYDNSNGHPSIHNESIVRKKQRLLTKAL